MDDGVLPDHHSAVRSMLATAHRRPYLAYASLSEAAADPEATVVMDGDYGGQVYGDIGT